MKTILKSLITACLLFALTAMTQAQVAAAAGIRWVPLRHECRHDAETQADFLHGSLEKRGAIRRFQRVGECNRAHFG